MWIINYTKIKLNKSHMSNFKCQKRYKNMRKEKNKLSFLSSFSFFFSPFLSFRLAFFLLLCSLGNLPSRKNKFFFLLIFASPCSLSLTPTGNPFFRLLFGYLKPTSWRVFKLGLVSWWGAGDGVVCHAVCT